MKTIAIIFFIITLGLIKSSQLFAVEGYNLGTPLAAASSVSLVTTQTALSLATGTLQTTGNKTSPRSYAVRVRSANGGLKNATAISKGATVAAATVPYTISIGNSTGLTLTSATIDSTSQKTLATVLDNKNGSGTTTIQADIQLTRTGTSAANLYSGTYTDTLTIVGELTSPTSSVLTTATLVITTQVVQDTITLSISPTTSASNLPLASTQSQLNIGTVSITANCQNGYTLTVASTNSGKLINTAVSGAPAANEYMDYNLFYQGSQVATSSTPVTIATSSSATMLSTSTQIGSVGISYTGVVPASKRAGAYQDNLVFTLQSQ